MNILPNLFSKKQTNDKPQEFRDLRWGTMQPVLIRLGDAILQLAAWGNFDCAVSNPEQFKAQVGDAQGEDQLQALTPHLRNALSLAVGETLAEMSQGKSDLAELVAESSAIAAAIKARAEPSFNAMGLTLKSVSVLNIQSRP